MHHKSNKNVFTGHMVDLLEDIIFCRFDFEIM